METFIMGGIIVVAIGALLAGLYVYVNRPGTVTPEPAEEPQETGLSGVFRTSARIYGLKPGVLESFAEHESSFNPNAVGDGGRSRGLMQIWEPTADSLGIKNYDDLFRPEINIDAAARLMTRLKARGFDGPDLVAAYNSGAARKNDAGEYVNSKGITNVQRYVEAVTGNMKKRGIDPQKGLFT